MSSDARSRFGRFRWLLPILCLVAVELASRAVLWYRTPAGMVFRDDIIYTYAPHARVGTITLNRIGCIGDDLDSAAPDDVKVLLLGGSTSFSPSYVDTVRARLGERLPGRAVRVCSCGKPRYTSAVNRVLLDELAPSLRPTVVVLYLGINDNIYNTFPWTGEIPNVGYFDWRDPTTSVFFELLRYHLVDKRLRSHPDFTAGELRSVDILRRNVEAMVETARQHSALPVLATFAIALPTTDPGLERKVRDDEPVMEHFWGSVGSTRLGVEAHNQVLAEIATAHDLPLARVAERIPHDGAHFLDMCHLTFEGNRILGTTIADAVADRLESRPQASAR